MLVEHCYKCHSAKSAKVKGELLLDSRAGTLKGGESGSAIVAGDVDDSLLIQAIRYESFEMPPKEQLPANIIADFEKSPSWPKGISLRRKYLNTSAPYWSMIW